MDSVAFSGEDRTMTVTLHLTPEVEAKIRDALAHGNYAGAKDTLADLFLPTIESILATPPEELSDEEFERLADQLADEFTKEVGENGRQVFDSKLDREFIYGDHP